MLKFIKWLFFVFSSYVNSFESKVDKFFRHIKSTDSISDVRKDLLDLMQKDLIVVNLWLEKKFKGYKYLDKSTRREMYENQAKIVTKFREFCQQNAFNKRQIGLWLEEVGLIFPNGDEEKLQYLAQVMQFLQPGKYYHYIKTASFGKLLRDPENEKLEGDCNQIVTLYIYLFSLKFPIDELKIKLLPEHVCLRFREVDIEATNGTFQNYEDDTQILPVTEIVSTNLLDLHDFREEVLTIAPRDFVKSAQLAYAISSLKSLVSKNLEVAYHNLALNSLDLKDFEAALFFASKLVDKSLLKTVNNNASVYYLEQNNFEKAYYYASAAGDAKLMQAIKHNENVRRYNDLLKKVVDVRTIEDIKRKKDVYREMLKLAQKMGDGTLETNVRETLRQAGL